MAIFGEFVPPSPGANGYDLKSGSPGEISRWSTIANIKTVALSGGNYTSVKAACDAVAAIGPTDVSPWKVQVHAGVFTEAPFTVPQYTILEGAGEEQTVIVTNSAAAHFIALEPGAEISKCAVSGPANAGQSAIRRLTAGLEPSFVSAVMLRAGYYGILCDPPAARANLILSDVHFSPHGDDIEQFVRSTGFGSVVCNNVTVLSDGDIVYNGFVCDGADALLTFSGCGYDAVGGDDAVFVNNGGTVIGVACLFENGTNAIHVGNGGASFVAIHASVIRGVVGGFTKDIFVESALGHIHYSGSLSRTKIDNAVGSPNLLVNATNIEPGADQGQTIIGEAHLGPSAAGMTPLLTYGQATWLTGLVSGGAVTRHGAGSRELHVAAGAGFINDGTHAHETIWGAGAVTIAANADEYVYVDATSTIQHSAVQPSYASNIVLAQAKTNATDVLILTQDEIDITHSHSRLQEYLEDVVGPISVSGGATTLAVSAHPLRLDVDQGMFMVGLSERSFAAGTDVTWVYWYRLGVGLVWTPIVGQDHIDDAQYNNAGALAALGGGSWKKDLLFVVVNAGGVEYHVVYGQETFANQPAAEAGAYPVAPEILEHYAMRSGGIVVEGGVGHIDSVTDARPRIGQAILTTGAAGVHAALAGLAADDHLGYLTTGRADLWLAAKAPLALVTNGDAHDHFGGDGAQIDHVHLANAGVNTHVQIDAHIANLANPHAVTAAQVGAIFGNGYTEVHDDARTTLTGANSTSYPPVGAGTKLSMVTAALAAGTYRLSWSCVADYDFVARAVYIRVYNVTDAAVLWEVNWRPANGASRRPQAGQTLVTFAGAAKTIALQFRTSNTADVAGISYARMDLFRVT